MNQVQMYQDVGQYSEVLGASNYQLIGLLLAKAHSHLRGAVAAIEHQDIPTKCRCISSANDIIIYLRECLNFEVESEMPARLDKAYAHLEDQLVIANLKSSVEVLQHCEKIIVNIKTWWEKIGEHV